MIRLLFVVPYPELKDKVEYVLATHPEKERLDTVIKVLTVDQVPDYAEKTSLDQYDAIIGRGYSSRLLRSLCVKSPVIDLKISGYDIIRAVIGCREQYHVRKIAVCGFFGKLYEAKSICRYLDCDVETYAPETYEELEQNVQDAVEKGCEAMIGGYSAGSYAEKLNLPYYLIRTGEDQILQSINEAIRTVDEVKKERAVAEMYKTIIYASQNGILFVDSNGVIQVRNRAAKAMNREKSMLGRPLEEVFPKLAPGYREVLNSRKKDEEKIYQLFRSGLTVSVSMVPVVVGEEVSGVVITLIDITQIQNLESQIRRNLNEKGLRAKYTFPDIVHQSAAIDKTIAIAQKYAESDSNVIIVGETGTGKELFAQSIHNASQRRNGPFVAINCAALPENLLESELFGYVEGAFTSASKGGKMGLFEMAHGGTLFLDEIGEISMSIQSKLLRVLQEREVRRIGDSKVISINVRIISATNKSIHDMANKGTFRKDLVYRLDVLRLYIPPLREREQDAELLFLHLLKEQEKYHGTALPRVDMAALSALRGYYFEGNVRELGNIVERTRALCDGKQITREDILQALYPPDVRNAGNTAEWNPEMGGKGERELIEWALRECGGNQSKAAKMLGIDRSTLWRKRKKYGSDA